MVFFSILQGVSKNFWGPFLFLCDFFYFIPDFLGLSREFFASIVYLNFILLFTNSPFFLRIFDTVFFVISFGNFFFGKFQDFSGYCGVSGSYVFCTFGILRIFSGISRDFLNLSRYFFRNLSAFLLDFRYFSRHRDMVGSLRIQTFSWFLSGIS